MRYAGWLLAAGKTQPWTTHKWTDRVSVWLAVGDQRAYGREEEIRIEIIIIIPMAGLWIEFQLANNSSKPNRILKTPIARRYVWRLLLRGLRPIYPSSHFKNETCHWAGRARDERLYKTVNERRTRSYQSTNDPSSRRMVLLPWTARTFLFHYYGLVDIKTRLTRIKLLLKSASKAKQTCPRYQSWNFLEKYFRFFF